MQSLPVLAATFLLSLLVHNGTSSSFHLPVKVIAIGLDNYLYTKRNFSTSNGWIKIPNSCCVTKIQTLKNGAIVGVGKNKNLYLKRSLFSNWRRVPKSCCVSDVTTMKNKGARVFIGLGAGGKRLYMKKTLRAKWKGSFKTLKLISIAGAGKKLFGLSDKKDVFIRRRLKGRWAPVPRASGIVDIFVTKNKLYGITTDHHVRVKSLKRWHSRWRKLKGTCCVKSFALVKRPVNASIKLIGVGKNYQLYFQQHLSSSWGHVISSGIIKTITTLRDGRLVGIGMDLSLYYREFIGDASWKRIPNSCCVKSVTELKNGKLVGVGTDNHLWERPALEGKWTRRANNSCCVTGITAMGDGSLAGIGLFGGLYQRFSLDSAWKGPLGNSLDVKLIDIKYSFRDGLLYGVTNLHRVVRKACPSIDTYWESISANDCCVFSIAVR